MFSRRILMAALSAAWILAAPAGPAAAADPARVPAGERPLTSDEQAASDRKFAAARRYLSSPEARAAGRATLACVTPETAPSGDDASGESGTQALDGPSTDACQVPGASLPVSARDQLRGHWCGPAVGQVIANYTWAVALDANKYTQAKIAAWMQTDLNGGTSAYTMEDGLELATAGAPRRPGGWDWVVSNLFDADRDGTVGDQLHDFVRSNVTGSRMPLAIPVRPHDVDGRFHLSSWPNPARSPGHWIAAYGWRGMYDGTNSSQLFYTDSSRDEGGSTGLFWDPMRHIAAMIMDHTRRFVW